MNTRYCAILQEVQEDCRFSHRETSAQWVVPVNFLTVVRNLATVNFVSAYVVSKFPGRLIDLKRIWSFHADCTALDIKSEKELSTSFYGPTKRWAGSMQWRTRNLCKLAYVCKERTQSVPVELWTDRTRNWVNNRTHKKWWYNNGSFVHFLAVNKTMVS